MKIIIPIGPIFMLIVISVMLLGIYKSPEIFYTFSWGITFGLVLAISMVTMGNFLVIEYKKKWRFRIE